MGFVRRMRVHSDATDVTVALVDHIEDRKTGFSYCYDPIMVVHDLEKAYGSPIAPGTPPDKIEGQDVYERIEQLLMGLTKSCVSLKLGEILPEDIEGINKAVEGGMERIKKMKETIIAKEKKK